MCGKENVRSDHDVNCPHAAGYRIARHNYIVAKVPDEIDDYFYYNGKDWLDRDSRHEDEDELDELGESDGTCARNIITGLNWILKQKIRELYGH